MVQTVTKYFISSMNRKLSESPKQKKKTPLFGTELMGIQQNKVPKGRVA